MENTGPSCNANVNKVGVAVVVVGREIDAPGISIIDPVATRPLVLHQGFDAWAMWRRLEWPESHQGAVVPEPLSRSPASPCG
jgi:hypothetical protein